MTLFAVSVLAVLAVMAVAAPASASAGAGLSSAPPSNSTLQLTAEQLASSVPKTLVIDTRTGQIISSHLGFDFAPRTAEISVHAVCNSSDSCFVSGQIPYADQGFYGTAGTKNGSWPQRSRIDSVGRTVKGCWGSTCSPRLPPYTQVALNPRVTGTSFTIY